MTKERRQWSEQQKLQIIQEVEVNGLLPVHRKYDLSQSLFHKWKRRFNQEGVAGLSPKYHKVDPEKRRMEQEIKRLRELVGELKFENHDRFIFVNICYNLKNHYIEPVRKNHFQT